MTTGDRVQAVQRFGFSRRQAAFLVTVMSYSGVCLPRQYATLAGIAYGHRVNRFFERLVGRGFVSACPCLHNRAFVYRLHHRALYGAIGEPQSRFRRPVPAAAVTPRLMLLDAVLEAPEVIWLASEEDKVEHFTTRAGIPLDCLPRQAARAAGAEPGRLFPDALPIGVEPSGCTFVVYAVTTASLEGFRPFLRRHVPFLTALPAWTLRLVITPDDKPRNAAWEAVIDREIGPLLGLAGHTERRVEWWRLGHRYGHLSPLVRGYDFGVPWHLPQEELIDSPQKVTSSQTRQHGLNGGVGGTWVCCDSDESHVTSSRYPPSSIRSGRPRSTSRVNRYREDSPPARTSSRCTTSLKRFPSRLACSPRRIDAVSTRNRSPGRIVTVDDDRPSTLNLKRMRSSEIAAPRTALAPARAGSSCAEQDRLARPAITATATAARTPTVQGHRRLAWEAGRGTGSSWSRLALRSCGWSIGTPASCRACAASDDRPHASSSV